ncbi:aldose epimerase family protein [Puia dinghuensis]|uniref:Aldose 1-epimerase n=1 Tax=Puia dinghuensis TaxID=1792502 RepID=A0A8J2UDF7_9BACT|nr:aldose epimerase family protein [Puia dinghuensis]GGB02378.1 aldose 1-epimerase [Puia dinghuensis]
MLTGSKSFLSCSVTPYSMLNGREVSVITLNNGNVTVGVTNIGCSIMSIHTPDRHGVQKNIVAGFADPLEYLRNPWYFGSVIGRYVNRISGACYHLDDRTIRLSANDSGNHLHGGFEGFNKKVWRIIDSYNNDREAGVLFDYTSPDGEEGYPGNLYVQLKYTLNAADQFQMSYLAMTDKPTPVNLSNHSYFNLSGFDEPLITDHVMMIRAKAFTEKQQQQNLPTGRILPVQDTPLDLSSPKRLGEGMGRLAADGGFDHNYVLDGVEPAVEVVDPHSGRLLRMTTGRPGVQLYTANWWDGSLRGAHAQPYRRHGAFALETQAFPDGPNRPEFPNTILRPGHVYQTKTIFTFAIQ